MEDNVNRNENRLLNVEKKITIINKFEKKNKHIYLKSTVKWMKKVFIF